MILEFLIAIVLGILAGTLTGISPGVHINLVSAILISLLGVFSGVPGIVLVVFLVSMTVTHTFIDFIPSVYFGAPDEDSFLSVLPGHKMLLEGKGHEAVVLTLYGSLIALLIIIIFSPLFIIVLPYVYSLTVRFIPYILIFASFYLIFRERNCFVSLIVFILAGALGYYALNFGIEQPMLPLLSGMFGASSLLVSLKSEAILPEQKVLKLKEIAVGKMELLKSGVAAMISAPLCSFLPGLGSGHAAVIGAEIIEISEKGFLVLVGAINTIVAGLAFAALYSIGKTRSGIAVAVKEIIGQMSLGDFLVILGVIVISGTAAFFLGLKISVIFAKNIKKISYKKLSAGVIGFLILLTGFFSGFSGLIVLIIGSALGFFAILSGSRRINLMGALIIPVVIYYLV